MGGDSLSVCWSADGSTVVVGRKVGTVISPSTLRLGISEAGRVG